MPTPVLSTDEIYKKLEERAFKAANPEEELTDEKLEQFQKRGKAVFSLARISKEDLDNKIGGRALEMTEQWEKEREEKRLKKKLDKHNTNRGSRLSLDAFREQQKKKEERWAKLPIINIPYYLAKGIASIPHSIARTIELGKNKKIAMRSPLIEKEARALAGRVEIASEDAEHSEDYGVDNIVQHDEGSKVFDAIREYAEMSAKTSVNPSEEAKRRLEEAEIKAYQELNGAGNGDALANFSKIDHDLRGALVGKKYESEDNKEAVTAAIDRYLAEHISIISADVQTGLAAKEVYSKLQDKATIEHGVIAGIAVGLGSTLLGLTRSKAIQSVAGPGLVQHGLKVGSAFILGTVRAGIAEKNRQKKANIEAAVSNNGNNVKAKMDKKGEEHTHEIISSALITKQLKLKAEKIRALQEEGKNLAESEGDEENPGDGDNYEDIIQFLAAIKTRNTLQNELRIQLIGYNGRSSVEESKFEMFKAIAELKKALRDITGKDDIDTDIEDLCKNDEGIEEYKQRVRRVQETQKADRFKAAIKGGVSAAITAAAIDQLLHHEAIWEDFKDTSLGQKFINSDAYKKAIQAVKPTAAVTADYSTRIPIKNVLGRNTSAVTDKEATYENHERLEEYYHKPVIIENDPDGEGVVIAIDADCDGKITAADKIIGGSLERDNLPGIDLTDDNSVNQLNNELRFYNIGLEREAIVSSKYSGMTISEYLDHSSNAIDTSGGVDWSINSVDRAVIGDPVVVSADGMNYYEIPITSINGGFAESAKLFIDFDGDDGPGKALAYAIENGKAIVPADIVDTSMVGNGGVAKLMGVARVGEVINGNQMVSYVTKFGSAANLTDTISVANDTSGFAFTAVDLVDGERLSQFAVDTNNTIISNMSEIFNGIETSNYDHMPATIKVNDIGDNQADVQLASGATIKDFDVRGGYHSEYDAFENVPFKSDGNDTYLGTPITWDIDGDGVMSVEEEASYVKQMLVRTATNPYMLGQNASNYGILESDRLAKLGISEGTLIKWGISDGVIDSEEDLNIFLQNLKLPENGTLWDNVANETINEMETQLQGANFEVVTVTNRLSTYANSNRLLDTANASTARTAIYAYHANSDGTKTYDIGNQGWWCRKYSASKVGDLTLCEQKCIEQTEIGGGSTPSPTPVTPTPPPSDPLTPKNTDEEIRNAGGDVVPEYAVNPASPLSSSQYEVDGNNIYDHTVSTDDSAARAAQAIEDALAAQRDSIEGDRIVQEIENATNREEINNIGADLWRQFQGGY